MIRERPGNITRIFSVVAPLLAVLIAIVADISIGRFYGSYVERVAMDCCIAIIMAVSLNIVNGFTGQFSIGHAAFYAIGGYVAGGITYYASILLWDTPESWGGFSLFHLTHPILIQSTLFILAILAGGLVAAIAGWLVGLPSLRLRGDYLAIVTLGFGEIVRVLLQQTNEQIFSRADFHAAPWRKIIPPPVGGALGFINIPKTSTLFWTTLFACGCILFAWRLKKSTFGRAMIAIRENEIAAEAMGVNITRLKVWAFVFGAFFAGIAGALYAHEAGNQISPQDAGFVRSFDIVIMVVLGGLGSISGAIIAAILLTVANEWLRDPTAAIHMFGYNIEIWQITLLIMVIWLIAVPVNRLKSLIIWLLITAMVFAGQKLTLQYNINLGEYRMIIYALMLIIMMIVKPSGLFGTRELQDLFRKQKA